MTPRPRRDFASSTSPDIAAGKVSVRPRETRSNRLSSQFSNIITLNRKLIVIHRIIIICRDYHMIYNILERCRSIAITYIIIIHIIYDIVIVNLLLCYSHLNLFCFLWRKAQIDNRINVCSSCCNGHSFDEVIFLHSVQKP